MSRRPRGRPTKDRVKTNIYIEADTFAELEMYLIHPVKGRIQYGTLSALCNGLLRQFVTHLRKPDVDPQKVLAAYGIEVNTTDQEGESSET